MDRPCGLRRQPRPGRDDAVPVADLRHRVLGLPAGRLVRRRPRGHQWRLPALVHARVWGHGPRGCPRQPRGHRPPGPWPRPADPAGRERVRPDVVGIQPRWQRQPHAWCRMSGDLGDLGRFAEPSLLILVSLSDRPKHGYAIMEDMEAIGSARIGPGTLYAALARLD